MMNSETMSFLEQQWIALGASLGFDPVLSSRAYLRLMEGYSEDGRHYHNLEHVAAMLRHLQPHDAQLQDVAVVYLAVWYHDLIYNAKRSDNEAQSAVVAGLELQKLGFAPDRIMRVEALINHTASHVDAPLDDHDAAWLLDADLAALGGSPEAYQAYAEAIRKEYKHVPSLIYRPARKKILKRFLSAPRLYRTDYFYQEREEAARRNLQHEIDTL